MRRQARSGIAALIVYAVATVQSALAGELRGVVVSISDGDTLTVLDAGRHQHRVRLAAIDAPEKGQPFAERSKRSLAQMCFGRQAVVYDSGHDKYGRTIGRVVCDGVDAGEQQLRRGLAWVFPRYATDVALYDLQAAAKSARRGLWLDPSPVPPWLWRANR